MFGRAVQITYLRALLTRLYVQLTEHIEMLNAVIYR